MLPELSVLVGRAAAARVALESLLDVIPGDYWERRAQGDAWSAYEHLEHLATVDDPTRELLLRAAAGETVLRPYETDSLAEVARRREAEMHDVAGQAISELRERMRRSREELLRTVASIDASALDAVVLVPGAVNAWGQPVSVSLRHYLASWAVHDSEHAEAIREAITTPPSPGDLALAARRRPR